MMFEHIVVVVAEATKQACRALDVGEDEGHQARRQIFVPNHPAIMAIVVAASSAERSPGGAWVPGGADHLRHASITLGRPRMSPCRAERTPVVVVGTRLIDQGETTEVLATPAETGDRYRLRVEVEPGAGPGIGRFGLHLHPAVIETFSCVSGQMTAALGRERRQLDAGDALTVPEGTAHGFVNSGDGPLLLDIEMIFPPPGPRLEADLVELGVIQDALLRERRERDPCGALSLLQFAVLIQAYPLAVQLSGPAGRLIRPLAWLGRRRGYRSTPPAGS